MARIHGRAGKALGQKLMLLGAIIVGAGFVTFLLVRLVSPLVASLAPLLALIVIMLLLKDRLIQNKLVAYGRGYLGETGVGKVLEALPSGWRVFNDVDLNGENVDHVVVSSRGVFSIEVKNYRGRVKAKPEGLYTYGKRNDAVVRQAHRQAHKLRELLGVEVQPVLVFVGSRLDGGQVGSLPVVRVDGLLPLLQSFREKRLDYERAKEVFAKLDTLTR